jgi:predicted metalloprotease
MQNAHNTTTTTTRSRRLIAACVVVAAAAVAVGATQVTASARNTNERPEAAGSPVDQPSDAAAQTDWLGDLDGAVEDAEALHRPGDFVQDAGTGRWTSMHEFLEFVVKHADGYWTAILTGAGYNEPWVNYLFPEEGIFYNTGCGLTNDRTMEYCGLDDQIVFSQALGRALWNGTYVGPDGQKVSGMVGDFATATMVAHEMAHSIQAELGVLSRGLPVPKTEKHADCWAGVWAKAAERDGLLDPGDVREGLTVAFLVGDSFFDSPAHHGTSEQRQEAFWTGYSAGVPSACSSYLA